MDLIFHHPGESSIDESIFNAVGITWKVENYRA
jgi:hypothetical protein